MGERPVVVDARHVAAGAPLVRLADALSAWKAANAGGVGVRSGFAGLRPVVQQVAEIGERVAQGAKLPVQKRRHPSVAKHHVADAIVAVNDGRAHLLRHVLVQQPGALLHFGDFVGLGGLPLPRPALQLALQIRFLARQVAKADVVGIDKMQRRQNVDNVFTGAVPLGRWNGGGSFGVVRHDALHELHDVERLAVDVLVFAQAVGPRHRHAGAGQRGDDAMLAAHVVGALQNVAERRPPQHVGRAPLVGEAVGEVGVAAGDQGELQGRRQPIDAAVEPLGHPIAVNALHARLGVRLCGHAMSSLAYSGFITFCRRFRNRR